MEEVRPTHNQIAEFLINNIINEMTRYLMDDYNYSLEKALETIYHSNVIRLLQQEEDELYVQSPSYVYELLLMEKHLYPKSEKTQTSCKAAEELD